MCPFAVGPHDHHAARAVPALGGGGEARGVAPRLDGKRGVLRGHAQVYQPPLQRGELLFTVFASVQDPSEE